MGTKNSAECRGLKEKRCCKDSLAKLCNNVLKLFFTVLVQKYHAFAYHKNGIKQMQTFENQSVASYGPVKKSCLEFESQSHQEIIGYDFSTRHGGIIIGLHRADTLSTTPAKVKVE